MIRLTSYANPVEAEMACEFLKAQGIRAEVADGTSMSVFGAGNPLTAQMLVVDRAQSAEARALLAGYAKSQSGQASTEGDKIPSKRFDGYYEASWNERERAAESAFRAAVIGWFVPFVSWWAAWKLMQVVSLKMPLNVRCSKRAKIAAAIMSVPALLYLVVLILVIVP